MESNRRKFLKLAGATSIAGVAGLSSCGSSQEKVESVNINFNKTYRWKMTTTWPPNFPVVGEGCQMLADWIKKMSGGRLEITVFGGGELIPALEGFDAVSNGAVEMNHGAAYYWAGKVPASQFFAAVPFGMNAQQMGSWILSGGGQKLWEEIYEPFGLQPFLCGNTGVQMGGWFNKEINSIDDLKGLKMRIPGLGGKVLAKAGGTPVLVSGGEIYTNLERGVIDAAEWIGPFHDYKMGFHQVADYYYYPGWHETGPALEMIVNKAKYEALPDDLQQILATGCTAMSRWMTAEFDAKNGEFITKLKEEEQVDIRMFPMEVLNGLRQATTEAISELTERDAQSARVYASFSSFKTQINNWMNISEKVFYETL